MAGKFEIAIPGIGLRLNLTAFIGAVAVYVGLSIYLYQPYLDGFDQWRGIFIPATNMAAVGVYILSLRWMASWAGAFLAGLLYGFGPFMLGLGLFHPAVVVPAAVLPWLFMPAAYWPKRTKLSIIVRAILAIVPMAVLGLFFMVAAKHSFYPVPIDQRLNVAGWQNWVSPLLVSGEQFPVLNFYHAAIGPMIFGLLIFFRIHRWGTIILLAAGILLGILPTIGMISPIIWATIPVLCGCVIAGLGFNGIITAGSADSVWLALCGIISGLLACLCAITSHGRVEYAFAAIWYMLGAAAVLAVLAMVMFDKTWHKRRLLLLGLILAADIIINARAVVDKIF